VKDTPFGGTLPIMINYPAATALSATHYRIKVDGVVRLDSWTDEKWNGVMFAPETVSPVVVNFQPGFYPVRPSPFLYQCCPKQDRVALMSGETKGLEH
jgi:hypothetical protein